MANTKLWNGPNISKKNEFKTFEIVFYYLLKKYLKFSNTQVTTLLLIYVIFFYLSFETGEILLRLIKTSNPIIKYNKSFGLAGYFSNYINLKRNIINNDEQAILSRIWWIQINEPYSDFTEIIFT